MDNREDALLQDLVLCDNAMTRYLETRGHSTSDPDFLRLSRERDLEHDKLREYQSHRGQP